MAYTKQTWEDLPSTNTPITASRLNHIEDGIESVETSLTPVTSYTETNTKGYSCDYINDCNTYSTSETFTGKYWVDGSKIYRKTIHYTSTNGLQTGSNSINHNISNIGTHRVVVEQEYIYSNINFLNYTNSTGFVCVSDITTTAITVQCGSGWNDLFKNAYITIEYTKTS